MSKENTKYLGNLGDMSRESMVSGWQVWKRHCCRQTSNKTVGVFVRNIVGGNCSLVYGGLLNDDSTAHIRDHRRERFVERLFFAESARRCVVRTHDSNYF